MYFPKARLLTWPSSFRGEDYPTLRAFLVRRSVPLSVLLSKQEEEERGTNEVQGAESDANEELPVVGAIEEADCAVAG